MTQIEQQLSVTDSTHDTEKLSGRTIKLTRGVSLSGGCSHAQTAPVREGRWHVCHQLALSWSLLYC